MTIADLADPRLTAEIHVARIPALILAKGSMIGERLREPRKGTVHDKDLGDLWRLMAVGDPRETAGAIAELVDHDEVGADVRQSIEWTTDVLGDPVSRERAKSTFDTFIDPTDIDRVFELWRDALPGCDLQTPLRHIAHCDAGVGLRIVRDDGRRSTLAPLAKAGCAHATAL